VRRGLIAGAELGEDRAGATAHRADYKLVVRKVHNSGSSSPSAK